MSVAVHKRILISVDGSEHSIEAVRYVGRLFAPERLEVVLLNIRTKIPESFWDIEKEPAYHYKLVNITEWEEQNEKAVGEFMEHARGILIDCGVSAERVVTKIQQRKAGIARDIIDEASLGYDAVVVGRRGLSELKDILLGGIANKLVEKLVQVPLIIVGDSPTADKILLCMDNSEGAGRSVGFTSTILNSALETEITIFHVVRSPNIFKHVFGKTTAQSDEADWARRAEAEMEQAKKAVEPTLENARQTFATAGFNPEKVTAKVVSGVSSRAGAIIDEADQGDYGTIVVGRRGISRVQEFFMGRVSNKVVQLGNDKAIWVVH